MLVATELEALLRRLIREELARIVGVEIDAIEDDSDLRELVAERAAKMRAARGGGR